MFLITMIPTAENALSEGTEVAGVQRHVLAAFATFEDQGEFFPPFQWITVSVYGRSSRKCLYSSRN